MCVYQCVCISVYVGILYEVMSLCKLKTYITFSSSELRGHSCKLFKPRVLTNFGKFSFSFRVIEEWNMLTQGINCVV